MLHHKEKTLILMALMVLVMGLVSACATTDEATEAPATEEVSTTEEAEDSTDAEATEVPIAEGDTTITLATTTSTENSGLLAAILPDFETSTGYTVDVVAVGTGQALELGANGDADVVLVHARAREDAFVEAGNGTARYDVMFNDFVIVGPEDDPAGLGEAETVLDALQLMADNEVTFVSRGDDSGTHTKELALWDEAGIEPEGDWYVSAGQGMGAVLTMTHELGGYTLTDRGTFIAVRAEGIALAVAVEGDEQLANPYGVIPVNSENHPSVNADGAMAFVEWLTSVETQESIANYTVDGEQLFFPDSDAYREANN
jgi:tungstate transport system substrate-binding protein